MTFGGGVGVGLQVGGELMRDRTSGHLGVLMAAAECYKHKHWNLDSKNV